MPSAAIRLVLDTNVLVSALLSPGGIPAAILEGILELRWELLLSAEILEEYSVVLARRELGLPPRGSRETTSQFRRIAVMVFPWETLRACSDPSDDKFLSAGVAGRASHLVTGNLRHFPNRSFLGIRIVSPAEFIRESR